MIRKKLKINVYKIYSFKNGNASLIDEITSVKKLKDKELVKNYDVDGKIIIEKETFIKTYEVSIDEFLKVANEVLEETEETEETE